MSRQMSDAEAAIMGGIVCVGLLLSGIGFVVHSGLRVCSRDYRQWADVSWDKWQAEKKAAEEKKKHEAQRVERLEQRIRELESNQPVTLEK